MTVKKAKPPVKGYKQQRRGPQSAQQTIPYREMHKDGICRVADDFYTKCIEYEDINYSVASTEDQAVIFDGYCSFLNYFDAALPFQLSFVNHRSRPESRYSVNIPPQEDSFNSIRGEFTGMLKGQIAKSNNGIVRTKYITFGIHADGIGTARPRLERMEADIMSNYKKLGVSARGLNGRERLAALHSQLHPGGRERFQFSWDMIPKTGMGTKDFIAPDSFDFRQSRLFRVGQTWGAASYMQIMASELSDKLLAELLELDFLNLVDNADLTALLEDSSAAPAACSCAEKCEAGAVNTACPVCAVNMSECVGAEPVPEPDATPDPDPATDTEPQEDGKSGGAGLLILAVLAVLAAGGAGYYFKVYRPKQLAAMDDGTEYEDAEPEDGGEWDDASADEDDGPPWDEDEGDAE